MVWRAKNYDFSSKGIILKGKIKQSLKPPTRTVAFLHHVSVDLSSFWNLQPRSSVIVKAPWKETVHNKVHQNSPHGIWLLVSDSPLFRTQVVMIHLVSFRKKKESAGEAPSVFTYFVHWPLPAGACSGDFRIWCWSQASFFSKITLGCWGNFGDP